MSQDNPQISTTPPLPGLQLVQDLNKALQTLATDFSGATDPAAMAWPYSTWADTGTGTLKRRNAANSAWAIEGRLLRAHLPMYAQADVPALDIGPIYIIGKGPAEWVTSQYNVLTPDFPSNDDLQWLGTPVGVELPFHPNAPLPPTDDPRFRYAILTAGLTGAGQYNEGVLTDETVTGSDPTITATAVVSLAESPMDGQTIDLINTSRTFLRPGAPGPIVDSQNAAHFHTGTAASAGAHAHGIYLPLGSGSAYPGIVDSNHNALYTGESNSTRQASTISAGDHTHHLTIANSGGNEAHPRYIPRVYLMRIL